MVCLPCFLMDPSLLLAESFESLWLFSNVLSSQQKLGSCDQTHQKPIKTQEQDIPISPIPEKFQKHPQIPESSVPKRIFEAPKEKQSVEKKAKKRKRKNKKRSKRSLTKGLDLDHGYVSGVYWQTKFGNHGYAYGGPNEEFETKKAVLSLPINDCTAMKEQLRTWAHAVACSVR